MSWEPVVLAHGDTVEGKAFVMLSVSKELLRAVPVNWCLHHVDTWTGGTQQPKQQPKTKE